MLFDARRHAALEGPPWDEARARAAIARIVADTEARFTAERYWPMHPLDREAGDMPGAIVTPLYHGACGVAWALHYLQAAGAATLERSYIDDPDTLLERNRQAQGEAADRERASLLMGDTPIRLLMDAAAPSSANTAALEALIAGNLDHPARELMWGSPGTLLAALLLHARSGEPRWAALFRATAARLHAQLHWSGPRGCWYWTQDLYGRQSTYLGAVHGFAATAAVLLRGRHLLAPGTWTDWERRIGETVMATAVTNGGLVNWPAELALDPPGPRPMLMQFCHGAPGLVISLAEMPGTILDAMLQGAGEAIWAAGPLTKGSNLCHGTGGNGYAFLKLYRRTGERVWLERARAFAMHGIGQTERDARRYGQLRYSLWTGDPGFAIYLWDCIRAEAGFPVLDVFYPPPA